VLSAVVEQEAEEKLSVTELMDQEFGKIIGHDNIKSQLRAFHKKARPTWLDRPSIWLCRHWLRFPCAGATG
jgi:hypothetical protein